jgi:hypothetical protein
MSEQKHNPNPFIRAAMAAKAEREQKFDLSGIADKNEVVNKTPKMAANVPRANKVLRKAGRGR